MASDKPKQKSRYADLDLRVPFFRPMWRRVAVIIFLAIWLFIEISSGSEWWALLVGGIGAYAVYVFFFDFRLPDDAEAAVPGPETQTTDE